MRTGDDITVVSWGSCASIVESAIEKVVEQTSVTCDQFELSCLSPLQLEEVIRSVSNTRRILVIHKDYLTSGLGAEVLAQVSKSVSGRIHAARLARTSFVPRNRQARVNALPSFNTIVEKIGQMTGHEVRWSTVRRPDGPTAIRAMGSGPSDHEITVTRWKVQPGDSVQTGQVIAELEAEKASFDFSSPVTGKVIELLVAEQDSVTVGNPLLDIETTEPKQDQVNERSPQTQFRFVLERKQKMSTAETSPQQESHPRCPKALGWMSRPAVVVGSGVLHNDDLADKAAKWNDAQIFKRVGIRSRPIVQDGEDEVSIATQAARQAISDSGLTLSDFPSVLCSTTTAIRSTPSVACDVLKNLVGESESDRERQQFLPPALDINAACSGFLFGLQIAFDQLQQDPRPVLLLTSEVISHFISYDDPSTAYVFGDAATATVLFAQREQTQYCSAREFCGW